MGEVVQFSDYCKGCKTCLNLLKVGKSDYLCTEMQWSDGSDVYPIENGEKTEGYNICKGAEYIRKRGCKREKRGDIGC